MIFISIDLIRLAFKISIFFIYMEILCNGLGSLLLHSGSHLARI